MKRSITGKLLSWKNSASRKPLVLKGTRQVGKTWSIQHFGKQCYTDSGEGKVHYIDLREAGHLHTIFTETFDPRQIIKLLGFQLRQSIDPERDLLILDEIQECPHAVTSLKYFQQDLNELDIIVAGSHLGLMNNEESFPVGKVNFLSMHPLTFNEFVEACDEAAFEFYDAYDLDCALPSVVHERLCELHKLYLFTGGMPEVVAFLIRNGVDNVSSSLKEIRKIQEELILGYRADFSKYSGVVNANHINCVFDSLSIQLSKTVEESVKRFRFRQVIPNRRGFSDIQGPLEWLQASRLCIKNSIANKSGHPLRSYCSENRFKAFLFDVGILNCMLKIPGEVLLRENAGAYKGFILENFVAQELFATTNKDLISWQEGSAKIEFLITQGVDIIPLEVKSASRNRRTKSLLSYINRYHPPRSYKLTYQNYGEHPQTGITTIPVYCCGKLPVD